MALNLLDLVKGQLNDSVVQGLSRAVGINLPETNSALATIIPSLLGGLVTKGSNENGANVLLNLIKTGNHDGSILDNFSGLLGNLDAIDQLKNAGGGILSTLFGNKQSSILDLVTANTSIGKNASSNLMSLLAPMVMGLLGKQVKTGNLDVKGLVNMLSSQKSILEKVLPTSFANELGFAAANVTTPKISPKVEKKKGMGWLAWALPLVLLAVGGFIFLRGFNTDVSMKKQQSAFYVDANGNLLDKKGELVRASGEFQLVDGYYVDNTGARIQRKIDETKEKLNVASDKTKEKLDEAASKTKEALDNTIDKTKEAVSNAATITSEATKETFNKLFNTKAVGTAYALSEIVFDPTSHRITNMSKEEVEGLAAALKEHPESRIQVQVHTADGKNAAENKKISDLRAEVVKNMLVALGVDAKQISSKGLSSKEETKAAANAVEVVVEQ